MIQILHFFLRHLILIGFLAYVALGLYFHEALFPGMKLPSALLGSTAKPETAISSPQQFPQPDLAKAPISAQDAQVRDPAVAPVPAEPASPTLAAPEPAAQGQMPGEGFQFRPEGSEITSAEDLEYQNLMNQARTFTEKEDWAGAEAAYLRLTLEYPDKAEPYGELGNLYLYRKDKIKAADAYWQAARLKGDDQALRLQGLLEVLEQIDPDKAKSLREQVIKP